MEVNVLEGHENRSITFQVLLDLEDAPEMRYVTNEQRRAQHRKVLTEVDYPAVVHSLRIWYAWINGAWRAQGTVYGHILNPRTRERYSHHSWRGQGVTWSFGYGHGALEEMPDWVKALVALHTPNKPDLTGWVD